MKAVFFFFFSVFGLTIINGTENDDTQVELSRPLLFVWVFCFLSTKVWHRKYTFSPFCDLVPKIQNTRKSNSLTDNLPFSLPIKHLNQLSVMPEWTVQLMLTPQWAQTRKIHFTQRTNHVTGKTLKPNTIFSRLELQPHWKWILTKFCTRTVHFIVTATRQSMNEANWQTGTQSTHL